MIRAVAVGSPAGLHARAAALVARVAGALPVPVTVRAAGRSAVPADSVLALLTLGAVHGARLTLEADGEGASDALDRLAAIIAADLDAAGPAVADLAVAGPVVAGPAVAGPAVAGSAVAGSAVAGPAVAGSAVAGDGRAGG
jgi:phosphocarrier protein